MVYRQLPWVSMNVETDTEWIRSLSIYRDTRLIYTQTYGTVEESESNRFWFEQQKSDLEGVIQKGVASRVTVGSIFGLR